MQTKNLSAEPELMKRYDRGMLRSAFASLFWAVITDRRKNGFKLKELAEGLGCDKSAVSRWFSNDPPNWQVDTISDLAHVLNLELRIEARDRETGAIYTPSGMRSLGSQTTSHRSARSDAGEAGTVKQEERQPTLRGNTASVREYSKDKAGASDWMREYEERKRAGSER